MTHVLPDPRALSLSLSPRDLLLDTMTPEHSHKHLQRPQSTPCHPLVCCTCGQRGTEGHMQSRVFLTQAQPLTCACSLCFNKRKRKESSAPAPLISTPLSPAPHRAARPQIGGPIGRCGPIFTCVRLAVRGLDLVHSAHQPDQPPCVVRPLRIQLASEPRKVESYMHRGSSTASIAHRVTIPPYNRPHTCTSNKPSCPLAHPILAVPCSIPHSEIPICPGGSPPKSTSPPVHARSCQSTSTALAQAAKEGSAPQ